MKSVVIFKSLNIITILVLFLFNLLGIISPKTVIADPQEVLKWTEIDKPGKTGNIIVHPSEVTKFAMSTGNIIFAIDTPNGKVYRSENGGATWSDISSIVAASEVPLPAVDIAIAPDKPLIVALVTNYGKSVYLSVDGGNSWNNTNVPGISGNITCIAISRGYIPSNTILWDMAIGTALWGDAFTSGQVWATQIGGNTGGWTDQKISVNPPSPPSTPTNAEVSAIAFASNYNRGDTAILAVASTASDRGANSNKTFLCLGRRDTATQTTTWNPITPKYPITIIPSGDNPEVQRIISSIALPSDYNSTNLERRAAFVSYNRRSISSNETANDVYRIDYKAVNNFPLNAGSVTPGIPANICNIALYGTMESGKLLAGDYYSDNASLVQVRRSLNPFPVNPYTAPTWQLASQPPTGPGNAYVSWNANGTQALCGTSRIPEISLPPLVYDESAFSRSQDNGDNWEQISLVDTSIRISDLAPAPNSKSLFLATYSPLGPEAVWRSAGDPIGKYWARILTENTTSNRLLIRLSQNYDEDYTLFVAEENGNKIIFSHTRGNNWTKREVSFTVVDLVVADIYSAYVALPDGSIRKSLNEVALWQYPVFTGLTDINMLSVTKNGQLFVGSRDGQVAYSKDSGANFITIPKIVGRTPADVQVIADANYLKNNTIFAATNSKDSGVFRWVMGTSTEWEQIDKILTDNYTGEFISGLASGPEGTLYTLRMEPVNGLGAGGMNRTLNPLEIPTVKIEWDIINRTLSNNVTFNPDNLFTHTLPFLKFSGDSTQNVLWSVDTHDLNEMKIYRFVDNLCKMGAFIQNEGQIGCDPASGKNQGFDLNWEQMSLSNQYEVQVSKDDKFSLRLPTVEPEVQAFKDDKYTLILPKELITNPYYSPYDVTSPTYSIRPAQSLECGHWYYWRVRTRHAITGEFIRSPWSKPGNFVIKAGFAVTTPYYGIQLLAPDNNSQCPCGAPICFSWAPYVATPTYGFALSENPDMSNPIVLTVIYNTTAYQYDGKLKCNTNYFWMVTALTPAPSDWSATFTFKILPEEPKPTPPPPVTIVVPPSTPLGVWGVIFLWIILIILLLVLILKRAYQSATEQNNEDAEDTNESPSDE